MGKRVIELFCGFLILSTIVIGRIVYLDCEDEYVAAAETHGTYSLTLAETRGKIYDRNGAALAGGSYCYKAVVIPSAKSSAQLFAKLSAEELSDVKDKLKGSFPFVMNVNDGSGESDNLKIYRVPKRYFSNGLAVHLIGYCGQNGGESGIERAYDQWLSNASGSLEVTCRVNASGRNLDGVEQVVSDTTDNSNRGVMLTIDSRFQNAVETAASKYIKRGAVVVMSVENSEILAMQSLPEYNPNDIAAVLNDSSSPLVNRAVSAYNAGSVFKPVIAAAALEAGVSDYDVYECTGNVQIGKNNMGCINHTSHGKVDMHSAIAHSCNTYFINQASNIGAEKVLSMAQKLGFGKAQKLGENYQTFSSRLPTLDELKNPAALANFSFGQGTLTVTPIQIAAMFAAIARGGKYIEPSAVIGLTDENKQIISEPMNKNIRRAMSEKTAQTLGECLNAAVLEGTAKAGASNRVSSAAKTGTAQTGIIRNGRAINQAWYAGYYPYENPKYVCVVLAEDGESGGSSAGPVFKEIAERTYMLDVS